MEKQVEKIRIAYDSIKIDNPKYKAILYIINGDEVWIPRSLAAPDKQSQTILIPVWLAERNGLIEGGDGQPPKKEPMTELPF